MQPVYTMFYTLVLSSLFSMAWAEHDARFGSGGYDAKFGFIKDDAAAYTFVARSALACGAGVVLGVFWGIYMRRLSAPPEDHKQKRLAVFWYCCAQLVISLTALASFAASDALAR
jgi:DNA-directed RNA polymerase subunit N (RpoN/RPB10)